MSYKLLLLEDEFEIGNNLYHILKEEGYEVDWFLTGDEIINAVNSNIYDLLLLDVMLKQSPGEKPSRITNGLEVARIIGHQKIPYILLTARREPFEIMQGLDLGAEDYITKPYDLSELLARIRRVCKRINESKNEKDTVKLESNGLELNIADRKSFLQGIPVHLTPQLFDLLFYFMKHKNKILNKEELYSKVWGYQTGSGTTTNTLEVNVKRLRQAIGAKYITTVRGQGYVFEEH